MTRRKSQASDTDKVGRYKVIDDDILNSCLVMWKTFWKTTNSDKGSDFLYYW